MRLFTIGHSTRSWSKFTDLLREFDIRAVIDVRRYPSSRKFPHFNRPALETNLAQEEIEYHWIEQLGGKRKGTVSSRNGGLINPGFRNYADHMQTGDFRDGVGALLKVAGRSQTVVLRAEKLYWKCHRRLLSDYLLNQGVEIIHIEDAGRVHNHRLTPEAVIDERGVLTYPLPMFEKEKAPPNGNAH
jgi:uncharacterized protein (DUF488 family)